MTSQHFVQSRVCDPPADSLTPFELAKETDIAQVTNTWTGIYLKSWVGYGVSIQHDRPLPVRNCIQSHLFCHVIR